ncbi:hypothetical protein NL676_034570 [Syzygium grande]|nr:hypothetical protein NL676_034570 [Syzygium grande]
MRSRSPSRGPSAAGATWHGSAQPGTDPVPGLGLRHGQALLWCSGMAWNFPGSSLFLERHRWRVRRAAIESLADSQAVSFEAHRSVVAAVSLLRKAAYDGSLSDSEY